jgi:hypothetical protein
MGRNSLPQCPNIGHRSSKVYSGSQLCYTYTESSYFFAPFLNGSELHATHSMDPSGCTITSGLWLCSFRTLSEITPNIQHGLCWETNKSEREKRSVTLVDNEDYLAKIVNLSEFTTGKVYSNVNMSQMYFELEARHREIMTLLTRLDEKTQAELIHLLTQRNNESHVNVSQRFLELEARQREIMTRLT